MDFPIWRLSAFGGGFWIVLVAVLHVFVAHFAVGGGLFLVLTEMRARRFGSAPLLAYVRRYTKFFLLLTMVFGGLSGVGIWLVISVLSPQATLVLVRTFAWGWATEWAFFAGEIAALLIMYYGFDRLDARHHVLTAWCYFLFAFLSLFTINGIVTFMLTPGDWLVTHNFWDGFFNPTFWPSLAFRSGLALLVAGLFAFATALGITDVSTREGMLRVAARWVLISLPVLLLCGRWYLDVLPDPMRDFVLHRSSELVTYRSAAPVLLGGVLLATLALITRLPLATRRTLAVLLLLLGLGVVGTFETIREGARKPWLVPGLLWSTDIRPGAASPIEAPILPRARFARIKTVTADNRLAAGKELFDLQCLACHSVGGPIRDIRDYTKQLGQAGMTAYLTGQGKLFRQMPPFLGSDAERTALAAHIVQDINGKAPKPAHPAAIEPATVEIPPFQADKDPYVLLAWNTLGVVAMAGCDGSFSLAMPGNTAQAVLIKRDVMPEVVTQNVTMHYAAPKGFGHPSARLDFWKHAASLLGRPLPDDTSPTGLKPEGLMTAQGSRFVADGIPVTPYPETGGVDPYPVFTITARDGKTGTVLATTKTVLPVSTEMGCATCHGGSWRVKGETGVSKETARSILAVHDKRNGTHLLAQARANQPVTCQSCHPDVNNPGRSDLLSLSAAIHGFHANYLSGEGKEACSKCHPTAPNGVTQAQRDNHAAAGVGCPRCHGYLEDHAVSLLRHEQAAGKKAAAWLMAPLRPRSVASVAAVHPRAAWVQEPDCLSCHKDFARPGPKATAFNTWTAKADELFRNRTEQTGNVPCAACHGSPHATFVAVNDYGLDIHNIASLQYMGAPGVIGSGKRCDVCHTVEMDGDAHHPHMMAP